jgi:hypothetical protein
MWEDSRPVANHHPLMHWMGMDWLTPLPLPQLPLDKGVVIGSMQFGGYGNIHDMGLN